MKQISPPPSDLIPSSAFSASPTHEWSIWDTHKFCPITQNWLLYALPPGQSIRARYPDNFSTTTEWTYGAVCYHDVTSDRVCVHWTSIMGPTGFIEDQLSVHGIQDLINMQCTMIDLHHSYAQS